MIDYNAKALACAEAINPAILANAQEKARAGKAATRIEKRMLAIEADRLQYIALARNA